MSDEKSTTLVVPCARGQEMWVNWHGYTEKVTVKHIGYRISTSLGDFGPEHLGRTIFFTEEDAKEKLHGSSY